MTHSHAHTYAHCAGSHTLCRRKVDGCRAIRREGRREREKEGEGRNEGRREREKEGEKKKMRARRRRRGNRQCRK